jgi:ABC-2 type transport system permease protein
MTVFKTFLKILNVYKVPTILFVGILIFVCSFTLEHTDNAISFDAAKPEVYIINEDEEEGITKGLIEYLGKNAKIVKDIDDTEEAKMDALFYGEIKLIVKIPKGFRKDFLEHKNPEIEIKKTTNQYGSLALIQLEKYLKIANSYNDLGFSEEEIIENISKTLDSSKISVELKSNVDADILDNLSTYYSFANYTILAGCIYVIILVLSTFRAEPIRKRTIISSVNYDKYNIKLLLSNGLFALFFWVLIVLIGFILIGKGAFNQSLIYYLINSFVFMLCALSVGFLIANLTTNKEAALGIVNVISLGTSFLCGAFLPTELMNDTVLKIAHILPSYYYINTNERLKYIDEFKFDTLKPLFLNTGIVLAFTIVFITLSIVIAKKKRKIA